MISEKEHAKKRKIFTFFGIILVIIGFACFIAGPILFATTGKFYLAFVSFLGVFILFPGFVLLSLGTTRAMLEFQAQSVGPVAVEATDKYGKKVVKTMAQAVKEGLSDEDETIYCKYCGNEIDADSEFCKFCGKKLN